MNKYIFKKFFLLMVLFFSVIFNYAIANKTSYAPISSPYDLNQCKLKAKKVLQKSGYTLLASQSIKYISGQRGVFISIIACDVASRSGIAFIIVNSNNKANPSHEVNLIKRDF